MTRWCSRTVAGDSPSAPIFKLNASRCSGCSRSTRWCPRSRTNPRQARPVARRGARADAPGRDRVEPQSHPLLDRRHLPRREDDAGVSLVLEHLHLRDDVGPLRPCDVPPVPLAVLLDPHADVADRLPRDFKSQVDIYVDLRQSYRDAVQAGVIADDRSGPRASPPRRRRPCRRPSTSSSRKPHRPLARVAEAQAAADAIRQRAEQARITAEQEHDRHVLEQWQQDRDRLAADISNAQQQLRHALLADPVWQAMRQLVLAGHRQTTRWMEAESTHNCVHGTQQSWGPVPHTEALPYEQLLRMVENDATAQGRDEATPASRPASTPGSERPRPRPDGRSNPDDLGDRRQRHPRPRYAPHESDSGTEGGGVRSFRWTEIRPAPATGLSTL